MTAALGLGSVVAALVGQSGRFIGGTDAPRRYSAPDWVTGGGFSAVGSGALTTRPAGPVGLAAAPLGRSLAERADACAERSIFTPSSFARSAASGVITSLVAMTSRPLAFSTSAAVMTVIRGLHIPRVRR